MYHRFGEDDLPSTSIRLSQFEAHLAELTSGRYRVMALPEIVARLRAGQPLPQRAVAITIDDAALSVYREAWPRLKAAGLPFTLFVSTEPLDRGFSDSMSWQQLRELSGHPLVTVGNHGHRHAPMTWLHPAEQPADPALPAARLHPPPAQAPPPLTPPHPHNHPP